MIQLKDILRYGMITSLVLSVIFIILGFLIKAPPARYQDIVIGSTNAVILIVGILRLSSAPDERAMGRVSSQHLWIVFSLSTAVLSLLFGSYFYPGSNNLSYATIAIMSLISVITLFAVVSAATQRVPIFD